MNTDQLLEIIEAQQLPKEPSARLEYALAVGGSLRQAFEAIPLRMRILIEWNLRELGKNSMGMAALAALFPVHYFLLRKNGIGLTHWAANTALFFLYPWGADVSAMLSGLLDTLSSSPLTFLETLGRPDHRFLIALAVATVMWLLGIGFASRWTHEFNAGIMHRDLKMISLSAHLSEMPRHGPQTLSETPDPQPPSDASDVPPPVEDQVEG